MNKIVFEHYPVERLPDDIQAAFGDAKRVKLTVEAERPIPVDRDALVAELRERKHKMQADEGPSLGEATARIRKLRDEWDD